MAKIQVQRYEVTDDGDSEEELTAKRPRTASPQPPVSAAPNPVVPNINYMVYEIERDMVQTFRSLLLTDGVATATRPMLHFNKPALLISFKNWEEVARFYEWSCRGSYTQFLTKAIRIPCGSIVGNTAPVIAAKDMLEAYQDNSTLTQRDVEEQVLAEEEEQGILQEGYETFHLFLLHGVFCNHCQLEHRPFRPSH